MRNSPMESVRAALLAPPAATVTPGRGTMESLRTRPTIVPSWAASAVGPGGLRRRRSRRRWSSVPRERCLFQSRNRHTLFFRLRYGRCRAQTVDILFAAQPIEPNPPERNRYGSDRGNHSVRTGCPSKHHYRAPNRPERVTVHGAFERAERRGQLLRPTGAGAQQATPHGGTGQYPDSIAHVCKTLNPAPLAHGLRAAKRGIPAAPYLPFRFCATRPLFRGSTVNGIFSFG